jgi:hypothetical protein
MPKRYRVVQWATGNVGLHSLKALIGHPQYDLVGVKVYSASKAGVDAGSLCGVPATGILATRDIDAILAIRPDCVLYMPDRAEIDVLCQLLSAGINIVTSLTDFNYRDSIEKTVRARLESACKEGNSSLYATGSTPGYSTETLLFALTSIMRRIDCISQIEFADVSSRNSPEMLFDLLGFGREPQSLTAAPPLDPTTGLGPSMRMTAAAFSLPLDDITFTHEYATAQRSVDIPAGRIAAGTIGAMRMEIRGMHEGRVLMKRQATWFVTRELQPQWELPEKSPLWRYVIEGDTPLDVTINKVVSEEDYPKVSPGYTAHPAVNAVPYVCAAPAGIVQTDELPLILGNFM